MVQGVQDFPSSKGIYYTINGKSFSGTENLKAPYGWVQKRIHARPDAMFFFVRKVIEPENAENSISSIKLLKKMKVLIHIH